MNLLKVAPSRRRPAGFRNLIAPTSSGLVLALGLVLADRALAQDSSSPAPTPPAAASPPAAPKPEDHATGVPEIVVTAAKKPKPAKVRRSAQAPRSNGGGQGTAATGAGGGSGPGDAQGGNVPPMQQVISVDKTGTPLGDLPQSVVVVPRSLVIEQGGTTLATAVRDVSGVNIGGSSSYGFFDRLTIRGMDARIYSDDFPDGDQSNGFPHSLNGVERIEVMKGPGSAMLGTTTPGGSVNIVHFTPSQTPSYGISGQIDSFMGWSTSLYANGPTSVPGLSYRIDGLFQHTDGFRDLAAGNYEVRPAINWTANNHNLTFALDFRRIERTPDAYGIIYAPNFPLGAVPNTAKYSTPFSYGDQNFERATYSDAWWISDGLTINNRFSLLNRDVSILRNSGGTLSGVMLTKRQLREQTDLDDDFTYQFEPLWKFHTGSIFHSLLTGFQYEWQSIDDNRATASLPNITNIYAPVIPETSVNNLAFLRDASHSGMIDNLRASYLSGYAIDQMDITDAWKLRLGIRKEYWYESLAPQVYVPGRYDYAGVPLEPGMTQTQVNTPLSWSIGTLYKLFPGVAPFAGVAKSYLTNFNSESTSQGLVQPESGLQYEAGVKVSTPDGRFSLTAAAFDISRQNVFSENTATIPPLIAFNAQISYGFDADLQMQITPEWKLMANMISQTAKLTAVPLTPTQVGNWPIGVPSHIYNVWSTYDFALAGVKGFRVGAGLSYNSMTYGNTANNVWIPASTVADAMIGYYATHWDTEVGIKNITDAEYFTTAQSAGGYVGQPRTYYARAAWHY